MAATDAIPVPRKGAAFRVTFAILEADGDPVTTTTVTSTNAEQAYATTAGSLPPLVFKPGELVLQPGESLSFENQNSSNVGTDVVMTINWSELF